MRHESLSSAACALMPVKRRLPGSDTLYPFELFAIALMNAKSTAIAVLESKGCM